MKFKDNNLFDFINFVLKNGNNDTKDYKPPTFLVNRWLSMANPSFAKILNLTTNKWCCSVKDFDIKNFYRVILPKYNKKIDYIKKEIKENDDFDEDIKMAYIMECSEREINLFKQTIAELNIGSK
jgi:hypothetical protein